MEVVVVVVESRVVALLVTRYSLLTYSATVQSYLRIYLRAPRPIFQHKLPMHTHKKGITILMLTQVQ